MRAGSSSSSSSSSCSRSRSRYRSIWKQPDFAHKKIRNIVSAFPKAWQINSRSVYKKINRA